MLAKWVFGTPDANDLVAATEPFDLEVAVDKIACPLLIVHGTADEWGTAHADKLYSFTKAHGVDVEIKWFTPEETGAAHCQCDNPTLGMEYICDWIADRLGSLRDD